jgi:nitronate monooxygenase
MNPSAKTYLEQQITSYDPARLFGRPFPIIQAPMAGVATPALAAAVSNAGGLGSLGIGSTPVIQACAMIKETRALTDQPFNVNVFCHTPPERDTKRETAWVNYLSPLFSEFEIDPPITLVDPYKSFLVDENAFHMVLEQRPPIVSFHFGVPSEERLVAFREVGIKTMATATNVQEAKKIEQAGIDAIIAQGIEAGGHRGMFDPEASDEQLSTSVLVQLLTQRTKLPIIAAGGIMDGSGIKAALMLGASGVQMGTAFILCPESAVDTSYREALKSDKAHRTCLTTVLSGRPARAMLNRLISYGEAEGSPLPARYPLAYALTKQLNAIASQHGNREFSAQWAGQAAPLARELPAAMLIEMLVREISA